MKYRIRRVDGERWESVLKAIHRRCFTTTAHWPKLVSRAFWLAFDETGDAVAMASMRRSLEYMDAAYMERCAVLPAHRGHELQLRLIKVRERHARKLGLSWMRSDTTRSIGSANNLARAGYRIFRPLGHGRSGKTRSTGSRI